MKLSEPQASLLRTCRDGQPHSTGPATGGVASALERRGLVTCSYRLGTSVTITAKGREVLAALEGAGRQTSLPTPRRARAQSTTCPLCHRPGRLRAPPSTPTLHAHRDPDNHVCPASGETIESAKAMARRRAAAATTETT